MPSLTPIKIYRGSPAKLGYVDDATEANLIATLAPSYTVPAGKRAIIKHIRVTNLADDAINELSIKTAVNVTTSNGDYLIRHGNFEANDVVIFELNEIIDAGEKIFIWGDVNTSLAVQISGVEVTL